MQRETVGCRRSLQRNEFWFLKRCFLSTSLPSSSSSSPSSSLFNVWSCDSCFRGCKSLLSVAAFDARLPLISINVSLLSRRTEKITFGAVFSSFRLFFLRFNYFSWRKFYDSATSDPGKKKRNPKSENLIWSIWSKLPETGWQPGFGFNESIARHVPP